MRQTLFALLGLPSFAFELANGYITYLAGHRIKLISSCQGRFSILGNLHFPFQPRLQSTPSFLHVLHVSSNRSKSTFGNFHAPCLTSKVREPRPSRSQEDMLPPPTLGFRVREREPKLQVPKKTCFHQPPSASGSENENR